MDVLVGVSYRLICCTFSDLSAFVQAQTFVKNTVNKNITAIGQNKHNLIWTVSVKDFRTANLTVPTVCRRECILYWVYWLANAIKRLGTPAYRDKVYKTIVVHFLPEQYVAVKCSIGSPAIVLQRPIYSILIALHFLASSSGKCDGKSCSIRH